MNTNSSARRTRHARSAETRRRLRDNSNPTNNALSLAMFTSFKKADFGKLKTQTDGYKSRLGQLDTGVAKSVADIASLTATFEQLRNETSMRITSLINKNKELRGQIEQLQQRLNETIN